VWLSLVALAPRPDGASICLFRGGSLSSARGPQPAFHRLWLLLASISFVCVLVLAFDTSGRPVLYAWCAVRQARQGVASACCDLCEVLSGAALLPPSGRLICRSGAAVGMTTVCLSRYCVPVPGPERRFRLAALCVKHGTSQVLHSVRRLLPEDRWAGVNCWGLGSLRCASTRR